MTSTLLTVANLILAATTLGLGTVKGLAVRHQREWTLRLSAGVLGLTGLTLLLDTPVVYRSVGRMLHSPNIGALLLLVSTLVCVAHAHAMSRLWQPERRAPDLLRRTTTRWAPVYVGAVTVMTALYLHAAPSPATPLTFAAGHAHVPEVRALYAVYWTTLITTVTVTVHQCRSVRIPGHTNMVESLRRALGWLTVALGFDLVNALVTAVAMIGSATGPHRLDRLDESAWLATMAGCVATDIALTSLVWRRRRAERRAQRALQPLHDLVVKKDPTAGEHEHAVFAPRWFSLWTRFYTDLGLNSTMVEVNDGVGRLSPWWSRSPSLAVARLAQTGPRHRVTPQHHGGDWDLVAAQAAATMLHAAQARAEALPTIPPRTRLSRLPGTDIDPTAEREHLVRVAQHLTHPLVLEAAALATEAHAATRA
ncbi:hypothetical protein QQY66_18465 [Streptomyces sp. DG2A-72]|uniref:hypothetical protein n=1 Tax=Streptomyces sp. DG2A-72 TaxID=3051386 RepID=UPI00265B8968|nr:hypothetical protein [Streptomyces sp. DG2A-72]MDO0933568.1 hypothetical protein [Streptomyces sp. DG2A-72]